MSGIRVEIQLEDGSFTSGIMRAGQSLKSFKSELSRLDPHFRQLAEQGRGGFQSFNRMDGEVRSLTSRLRDFALIAGGAAVAMRSLSGSSNGLVGQIISVNAEMERLRYQLAGMSTAMDPMRDASQQVENLLGLAKQVPFSLGSITSTMVKMKVAGLDPMNGSMKSLLDGVAAFGGSDETLHRITLGITQMAGKGVIQMEELRQQLGESMPAAMKLMARSMGVSIGEFTRLVSTGRVEARSALSKWFEEIDRSYGGASDRMMKTFSGQVSRLKTALTEQVTREDGEVFKAFRLLAESLGKVVAIAESDDATRMFDAIGVGAQKALETMEKLAGYFVRVKDFVKEFGDEFKLALFAIVAGGALTRGIAGLHSLSVTIRGVTAQFGAMAAAANGARKAVLATRLAEAQANTAAKFAAAAATYGVGNEARSRSLEAARAAEALALARTTESTSRRWSTALTGTIGGLVGGLGKFLGMLGPVALGVAVLGPLAIDIGKAIFSWATGAKDAKKEVEAVSSSMSEITQSTLMEALAEERARQKRDLLQHANDNAKIIRDAQRAYDNAIKRRDRFENFAGKQNPELERAAEEAAAHLTSVTEKAEEERLAIIERGANREAQLFDDMIERQALERANAAAKAQEEQKALTDSWITGLYAQIKEGTARERAEYNRMNDELSQERDRRMAEEREQGGSGRLAREWYQEEKRKLNHTLYQAEADAAKKLIEDLERMETKGEAAYEVLEMMREEYEKLSQKAKDALNETMSVDLLDAPESDEKKIERLMRYIDSARDKVKDLSAELRGSSGALAKLVFQIQRGDFGNLSDGSAEAQRFRDELIQTTIAAEMLQGILENTGKAQSELRGIVGKMTEDHYRDLAELNGVDPDDDLAYFRFRLDNNLLGIGKDTQDLINEQFRKVTEGIDLVTPRFESLAATMQDTVFGNKTLDAIQRVRDAIEELGKTAGTIAFPQIDPLGMFPALVPGSGAAPTNLGPQGDAFIMGLIQRGVPAHVAEGLAWNAESESNFNSGAREAVPNKHGTRGFGVMQWTGPRETALRRFAGRNGQDAGSMETQLDFIVHELTNTHAAVGKALMSAPDTATAAVIALKKYLIPAQEHQNQREAQYRAQVSALPLIATQTNGVNPQVDVVDAATVARDAVVSGLEEAERQREAQRPIHEAAELARATRELTEKMDAAKAGDDTAGNRNHYQARLDILSGKFGSKDLDDPRYEEMLRVARELDEFSARVRSNNEATAEIERNQAKMDEQRLEIAQRRVDAEARIKDPNYRGQSADLAKLNALEAQHLKLVEQVHGKGSEAYRAAQAEFARSRTELLSAEASEALEEMTAVARAAEREAMTDRQQRRAEFEEKLAELAAERDAAIAAGMDVARANEAFERGRAALQVQYMQQSRTAMAQQVADMGRLDENLRQAASGWPQALSDALYEQDFESFGLALRESIARALTDKAASLILGPLMSAFEGADGEGGLFGFATQLVSNLQSSIEKATQAAGGGQGGGIFSSILSWISKLFSFGTAHTGAIVGKGFASYTTASPANFINAPRFHGGGIVGDAAVKSLNLRRDETPIIAQKGEGVFTAEQMKHLGGTSVRSQAVTINAPVTVNATGGSPEQNADLARQVSAETERAMRGLVREEMIKQLRPGGMLR